MSKKLKNILLSSASIAISIIIIMKLISDPFEQDYNKYLNDAKESFKNNNKKQNKVSYHPITKRLVKLVTYNVSGLPLYANEFDNPGLNHFLSSQIIAVMKPDIILVQENFSFQKYFRIFLDNYIEFLPVKNVPIIINESNSILEFFEQAGWYIMGKTYSFLSEINDGLSTFTRAAFKPKEIIHQRWNSCSNRHNSDCLAPKGFSFGIHFIEKKLPVHIYNVHTDAGDSELDQNVRKSQIGQLLDFINKKSRNSTIILAGDFNFKLNKNKIDLKIFKTLTSKFGFINPCMDDDKFSDTCDTLDHIFYKNSAKVKLKNISFQIIRDFLSMEYSDHAPILATFGWD
jgi:exonuclease III